MHALFSWQRFSILILIAGWLISCSPAKNIERLAQKNLYHTPALKNALVGISINRGETNKLLYAHQAETYFVPASNTKLLSCYTALKFLDDSLPGILYSIQPDSTIIVKPTGDPTLLHPDFYNQSIISFLKQFKGVALLLDSASSNPTYGSGWSWNDFEEYYMAIPSALPIYGNMATVSQSNGLTHFEPALFNDSVNNSSIKSNTGIDVHRGFMDNSFTIKPGVSKKVEITFYPGAGTIQQLLQDTLHKPVQVIKKANGPFMQMRSQLLDSFLKYTMHRSDNFYAEQCLLMASQKLTGTINTHKAIDTLQKTLFAALPQPPSWADGSGLSRYNLFTPTDFITILQWMKQDIGMPRLQSILATGGTGTLRNFYKNLNGNIFAKTGTLSGVVALSGYLYTRKKHLLLFSILVNNHNNSAVAVRKDVEAFLNKVWERY